MFERHANLAKYLSLYRIIIYRGQMLQKQSMQKGNHYHTYLLNVWFFGYVCSNRISILWQRTVKSYPLELNRISLMRYQYGGRLFTSPVYGLLILLTTLYACAYLPIHVSIWNASGLDPYPFRIHSWILSTLIYLQYSI